MNRNYNFTTATEGLPRLLQHLLDEGEEVPSRAGKTAELMHVGITLHKPWLREILVPERRVSIAAQIAETAWVLAGRDDIEWLSNYLPRAKDFSDDGEHWRAGYGRRLRAWTRREGWAASPIDQVRYVLDTLRESNLSRQAIASIWDPQVDTAPGKDIPCNDWLSFSIRGGKLDLHVAVRSNDAIWGWSGINAFEWSTLMEVIAGILGVGMGSLHFSTTSLHLYDRHFNRAIRIVEAADKGGVSSPAYLPESPRFDGKVVASLDQFDDMLEDWFGLEEKIRAGINVNREVDAFPEPLFRSWLYVLQWWWTGRREHLNLLFGTPIEVATRPQYSIQPKNSTVTKVEIEGKTAVQGPEPSDFLKFAIKTHNEKHAAYGDSWKRRGEMLGIMANIARKIDRLGQSETSDETSADTAMDLMVYLAKYRTWLVDRTDDEERSLQSDDPKYANEFMAETEGHLAGEFKPLRWEDAHRMEGLLRSNFDYLESLVNQSDPRRITVVESMEWDAYRLARTLWEEERDAKSEASQERDLALQQFRPEQIVDLLRLVSTSATEEEVASWSPGQRTEVVRWATAVHLRASDNRVKVPKTPAVLGDEYRGADHE